MSEHNFTLKYQSGADITDVTFHADSRDDLREQLKVASSIPMEKIWPIDYAAALERELGRTMTIGR